MNTAELSKYAPQARENFMAAVRLQAGRIGVREDGCSRVERQGEVIVIDGVTLSRTWEDLGTQPQLDEPLLESLAQQREGQRSKVRAAYE